MLVRPADEERVSIHLPTANGSIFSATSMRATQHNTHLYEACCQRENVVNMQRRGGTHNDGPHLGRYVHGWQVPPTRCAKPVHGHSCAWRQAGHVQVKPSHNFSLQVRNPVWQRWSQQVLASI
eukprot:7330004-Prymnesium_polylepis.2